MELIYTFNFVVHVITASMALILFWIPVMSRKGGLDHRRFGRYYNATMYTVAATGAVMAAFLIAVPTTIKANVIASASDPRAVVSGIRIFSSLLIYLALLIFVSVRHGYQVLQAKHEPKQLRTFGYQLPIWLLVGGGAILLVTGVLTLRPLHIGFGILGPMIGIGMLKYVRKPRANHNQQVVEHLAATIGSGIGAYTAFFTFGARQLLDNIGYWQLAFWILPGVVGSIAISMVSRRYCAGTQPKQQQIARHSLEIK